MVPTATEVAAQASASEEAGSAFDVVIIGGGPGGYATALYGAAAGLSVAMVEMDKVGGTCLHRGCVPAKEFLETAAVYRTVSGLERSSGSMPGAAASEPALDFSVSQARKQQVVDQLFKGLAGLMKGRGIHGLQRQRRPCCPTTGSASPATTARPPRSPAPTSCWPPGRFPGPSPASTSTGAGA